MGKYKELTSYLLSHCNQTFISLSFQEINEIISPSSLPTSAYIYREWWANDSYHSQAKSWYDAHFLVYKVKGDTVIFVNCDSNRQPSNELNSGKKMTLTISCPFCKQDFERSKIGIHIKNVEKKDFGSTIYLATSKFICSVCGHIINDFSESNINFHKNRECKKF